MSLWKIAWRNIQQRSLASMLTAFSMALGVMLVVAVLLGHGLVAESFRSNSSLGYNVIVGAKGGKLQLVLNTVYYLSQPVENVPYSYYQEFLTAHERGDGRDGRFSRDNTGKPNLAIPVCLGDYYKKYRVVGTTTKMFDDLVFDPDRNRKYEFARGRNFKHHSDEHGYFEAVLGATVAREEGLKLGASIAATHGAPEGEGKPHEHDAFHVVGILRPTGTPNDRAVFVNIEGFYLLEGHAKPAEEDDSKDDRPGKEPGDEHVSHDSPSHEHAQRDHADDQRDTRDHGQDTHGPEHDTNNDEHDTHDHTGHEHGRPLPVEEREVTAILVRTTAVSSMSMANRINEGDQAQVVLPIAEIYGLLELIVKPIQRILLAITVLICIVSGVSILVSIYNSMNDRRRDIAVMRALGASRVTVLTVILLESAILSLGGGLAGWIAGHGLVALGSPWIEARTGVSIGLFDLAPPVRVLELLAEAPALNPAISPELLLIPGLILLAVAVGFLPALAAYRTDVDKALSANP